MNYNISKGFTLVELLVVVVLVGVLSALAVANYQSYREKAYIAVAHSAARSLYTGAMARITDGDFNRKILVISATGAITLTDASSVDDVAPGYKHQNGLYANLIIYGQLSTFGSKGLAFSHAAHCKAPITTTYPYMITGAYCNGPGKCSSGAVLASNMGCP